MNKTYTNNYGLLAFSLAGKDYISQRGDALELPEEEGYVKTLVARGHLLDASVQPPKTKDQ
jgi:hypothetical protein